MNPCVLQQQRLADKLGQRGKTATVKADHTPIDHADLLEEMQRAHDQHAELEAKAVDIYPDVVRSLTSETKIAALRRRAAAGKLSDECAAGA